MGIVGVQRKDQTGVRHDGCTVSEQKRDSPTLNHPKPVCYVVCALIGRSRVERITHRFAGKVGREGKKVSCLVATLPPTSSSITFA